MAGAAEILAAFRELSNAKQMDKAELYGLPMYGVGSAPAPLHAALLAAADVPPVSGTTASTSPAQGSLSSFPGTGVRSAGFAAWPRFVEQRYRAVL